MNLNLNLNEAVALFAPWDFSITIDGQLHATRPMTLADRQILLSSAKPLKEIVPTLFREAPSGCNAWDDERCAAILAAVVAYRDGLSAKNSLAVGTMVSAAMNPARMNSR